MPCGLDTMEIRAMNLDSLNNLHVKTKLVNALMGIILICGTSCKKENTTASPTLSPAATHTVHVTTNNNYYELYLNSLQLSTDANNRATFTAKGGDVLKVVCSTGSGSSYFINMYIDGDTNPTVSGSYNQSSSLSYTFK